MKGVVVGVVFKLGEIGFRDMELEGAGLNYQPEYEDCEANEDDECNKNLPQYSEEAATTASSMVMAVAWLRRRRNGGTVIGAVQVGLLIDHACR